MTLLIVTAVAELVLLAIFLAIGLSTGAWGLVGGWAVGIAICGAIWVATRVLGRT